MKKIKQILPFLILFCLSSHIAQAQDSFPMVLVILPIMIAFLLPVIFVEAFVLKGIFQRGFKDAFRIAFLANAVSTFLGVPLTWAGLAFLQKATQGAGSLGVDTLGAKLLAVTWQAPWLMRHESHFYWMMPAATLFLFIPIFFMAWLLEFLVAKVMVKDILTSELALAVFKANLASYLLLEMGAGLWFIAVAAGSIYGL
jgi:hypothetical protein